MSKNDKFVMEAASGPLVVQVSRQNDDIVFKIRDNSIVNGPSHSVTVDVKNLKTVLPKLINAIFCHVTPHERDEFMTECLAQTIANATTSFSAPRREGGLFGL